MRTSATLASDFAPDTHCSADNSVQTQLAASTPDASEISLELRLVELIKDSQMKVSESECEGWILLSHSGNPDRPHSEAANHETDQQIFSCVSDVVANAAHFPLIQCLARDDGTDPLDTSQAHAWVNVALCRAASEFHANAVFTTVEFSEFRRRNGQAVLERQIRSFPMPLGLMNSFTVDVRFGVNGVVIEIGLEHEFAISSISLPDFGVCIPNLQLRDGVQNDFWGVTRARLRAASYRIDWQNINCG